MCGLPLKQPLKNVTYRHIYLEIQEYQSYLKPRRDWLSPITLPVTVVGGESFHQSRRVELVTSVHSHSH